MTYILNWSLVLVYVILNSMGALIIKNKVNAFGPANFGSIGGFFHYFFRVFTSPAIIGCFVMIFLSAVAWIAALSKMEISVAYPVATSLNFLIIIFVAIFFLGENLTIIKTIGLFFVFAGILFLTMK